jgi:hypothetical protein
MKTDSPAPDHEKLKALLANSFHSEEADDVPPLPDDLRERIREQYGKAQMPASRPAEERSETIFAKIARLFAQPAFRGAAAAIVLVAVAAVLLLPKKDSPGDSAFRGASDYTGVTILLYGFDDERAGAIAREFDPKAVKIVKDLEGQIAKDARTIVIDGVDGEIEGYSGPGSEPQIMPLPESPADIAAKVAELSVTLKK